MKVTNGLDLLSQKIINLADPSSATDAVTKQYADNLIRGSKWKDPVRAATTANGTLATAYANGQVIDGVTLVTGDRILLKAQTTGSENGIYTVNASGAPTRAVDAASGTQMSAGTTVYVTEGTTNADKAFAITTDGTITIGTTATTWGQIGGGTTYSAGNGLALGGTTFSVTPSTGINVSGAGVAIDPAVVARKASANIGNGSSTSIAFAHNLGTQDITVSVRDASSQAGVLCDWVATDTNTVTLTFAVAPASNAYRVTVTG
ncbi:MAG: hypothetical protein KGM49_00560 [Sphingomonadales bacterium]|nr:hypothetical protein [Sphingomonadales bacterium]